MVKNAHMIAFEEIKSKKDHIIIIITAAALAMLLVLAFVS
jgi:hypothetical protein